MWGNLMFWRQWKPSYRYLFLFFLLALAGILVVGTYWHIKGFENVIDWQVYTFLEEKPFLWKSIDIGLTDMPLMADFFVSKEMFVSSDIRVSPLPYYVLLFAFALAWCMGLTVITTFRSFWFYGSVGLLFFILVNLQPERLVLFGQDGAVGLIILTLLYFGPVLAIYFKGQHLSLPVRFMVFVASSIVAALLIYFFSDLVAPFYLFSSWIILILLIISIVFIVWIAHEPIAAFVYLASVSGRGGRANLNFLILSVIYLVDVFLVYLHNTQEIDWDILYLNEFLLLSASVILGLYGWRRSHELFKGIFSVEPEGLFLYLSMAIICVATAALFFATGNDPMIEVLEDAIIYSHLIIGLVFFLYVLINFYDLLQRDMAAHKVLYRPSRLPFFTQRLLSFIIILGLLFKAGWFPFYQSLSGYYIMQGDTYNYLGNDELAARNYETGHDYESSSFRVNYTLARYQGERNRSEQVIPLYEQSIKKNPSTFGFISLARQYEEQNQFFDALFLLQQGRDQFPDDGYLSNNIGLLFSSKEVYDSAFLYFDMATDDANAKDVAMANREAMLILSGAINDSADVSSLYNNSSYLPARNNLLLQLADSPEFPADIYQDSSLNNEEFAYLYNYLLHSEAGDTAVSRISANQRARFSNMDYADHLLLAEALGNYRAGKQTSTIQALEYLGRQAREPGKYYYLLAGIAADNMAYRLAADYLEKSAELRYETSRSYLAQMYLLSGRFAEADSFLTTLSESDTSGIDEVMASLSSIASFRQTGFSSGSEQMGADRLAIYLPDEVGADSSLVNGASATALAFSHILRAKEAISIREYDRALSHIRQAEMRMPELPRRAAERVITTRLDWYLATDRIKAFLEAIDNPTGVLLKPYKVLSRAMKANEEGNEEEATELYTSIINGYPFFEQGIIKAASYFYNEKKDELLGYESILSAIKVNPYSISLNVVYADYSLLMGLEEYGEDRLVALKEIMPADAYQSFYEDFINRKNKKLESATEWD